MRRPWVAVLGALAACSTSPSSVDSQPVSDRAPRVDVGRRLDATAGDRAVADSVPSRDGDAGPPLCPGGKTFFGGALSGVFKGTATVAAGAFNKAGTHPATLTLVSICGSVRAVLEVKQSDDLFSGLPTYKGKGQLNSSGALDKLVLSDRYCASVTCMPHLAAKAGMEIFAADLTLAGAALTSGKVTIRPGVAYPELEVPFTELSLSRTFPIAPQQASGLAGLWNAKVLVTSDVFAEPPASGDNQLRLSGSQIISWKIGPWSNALDDQLIFPSSVYNTASRRVGIQQRGSGGTTFNFAAVLDGSWLLGVVRDGGSAGPGSLDVPTELTDDDALRGIWIGQWTTGD